jgi:hypothetical protein
LQGKSIAEQDEIVNDIKDIIDNSDDINSDIENSLNSSI